MRGRAASTWDVGSIPLPFQKQARRNRLTSMGMGKCRRAGRLSDRGLGIATIGDAPDALEDILARLRPAGRGGLIASPLAMSWLGSSSRSPRHLAGGCKP